MPVTQKAACEHLGLSVSGLQEVLDRLGHPRKGFDLDALRVEYIADLREKAAGRSKKLDLTEERARHTHHQANIAAIDESVKKGEVIPADRVEQAWCDMVASWKAKARSIPTKAAAALMNQKKLPEIKEILGAYIDEALLELADYDPEQYGIKSPNTKGD